MSEPKKPPRRLSDEQLADIFQQDVLPGLTRLPGQKSPRMVLLGGPQGSRKTTLRPLVAAQLGLSDAVFYDGDDHYTYHPHHDALAREHGVLEASRLCGPDIEVLRTAILTEVHARGLNVMLIGPYTNEEYTLGRVAEFRAEGYSTEMAYTALHPALSQVGVMDRHRWAMSDGPGYSFLVSLELQQLVLDGVPSIMTEVEQRGLADALHLVDAGGVAFSKHLGADGTWTPSRPAREAVAEIRHQPWDPATRQDFLERRAAVAVPVGESAEDWGKRLVRVDELAAPMLAPPTAGTRPSAAAARKRSTTLPSSKAAKKAAPPSAQGPPASPAPGREASSGRSR
ncbi:zeta toxin family protein [Streptomyces sp. NPDC059142]|uniref:zeta toxin family protein n=1 Tax=Streptomyces sp. NPDC059142 TaxID=3346739 RepID=UPI0036CE004F